MLIPDYRKDTVCSSSLSPSEIFVDLEKQGYKHAYMDGDFTVQKFLEAGLINNIHLTRAPVLLGEGISLFGRGKKIKLRHLGTASFSNGKVTSRYEVLP